MTDLIRAFQFLTIFPLGWASSDETSSTSNSIGRAMAYFPVVGAVQGALMLATLRIFNPIFPEAVIGALLLMVLTLTNFGFHLDGFADTLDGIAGGKTKEDRLRIMRDSHIGPIGVTGLMILLLIKYAAITAILKGHLDFAILLFPIVARWSMVPMSALADYARGEGTGLGKAFSRTGIKTLIIATALTAIPSILLIGPAAIIMLALIFLLIYSVTLYFKHKVGGVTGDIFGFQTEITEAAFLLLALGLL